MVLSIAPTSMTGMSLKIWYILSYFKKQKAAQPF